MLEHIYNVLFIGTGNATRSIMAEAILSRASRRFQGFSAGSHPKGAVHPSTIDLLRKLNFDVGSLRQKSWLEFSGTEAPRLDFVFLVCDQVSAEAPPAWSGQPLTARWSVPDPAEAKGNEAEVRLAFADTFRMLSNRINIFVNLPTKAFSELTLQKRLDEIGKADDEEPIAAAARRAGAR